MPCSLICIKSASWLHLQPVYHILSEFDLRDSSSQRDEKLLAGWKKVVLLSSLLARKEMWKLLNISSPFVMRTLNKEGNTKSQMIVLSIMSHHFGKIVFCFILPDFLNCCSTSLREQWVPTICLYLEHNLIWPIRCAAVAGKLPVVKCLVQYGANVDRFVSASPNLNHY